MAHSRTVEVAQLAEGKRLTADMVGIGMLLGSRASAEPNVEDTLIAASIEGVEQDDLRVLAVLTTWIGIHHPRINADRLLRALQHQSSIRVRAFWAAIGRWRGKDRRLARLERLHDGPRQNLLRTGTAFQVKRRGEDPRFAGSPLRVPARALRDRKEDVLTPEDLASRHTTYRYRILIGPTYRADMWATLDGDPAISAAELARRTYGSFATAWNVKQDWALLHTQA